MDQADFNRFVKDRWATRKKTVVDGEVMVLAIGVAGEAGEVADAIKKLEDPGYGRGSKDKLVEELGDLLHYMTRIAARYGISFDRVREVNREKLLARDIAQQAKGAVNESQVPPNQRKRAGSRWNLDH